jgi:hypothetical protein
MRVDPITRLVELVISGEYALALEWVPELAKWLRGQGVRTPSFAELTKRVELLKQLTERE